MLRPPHFDGLSAGRSKGPVAGVSESPVRGAPAIGQGERVCTPRLANQGTGSPCRPGALQAGLPRAGSSGDGREAGLVRLGHG